MDSIELATKLVSFCRENKITLASVESCTGGLVAAAITDVPGASEVFDRGFSTYSNRAKVEEVEVPQETIVEYGAVSEEVARCMAKGALNNSHADVTVSVTGIAGPDGGSIEKPVGLVYIATSRRMGETICEEHYFSGERADIRRAAVEKALEMLHDSACKHAA